MNVESRQKAALWLAGVFVLGAATGGVFGYSFSRHRALAAAPVTAQLTEPERRAKRLAEMTKEMSLTPEQATGFDAIIHGAHDQMKSIRDKSEGDVDAVRQKARDQMRLLLTAEQKPKFEELVRRLDAERKKQEPQK